MNLARLMEKLEIVKRILANRFIVTGIFMATCLLVLGMSVMTLNTYTVHANGVDKVIKTYDTNINNVLKSNDINVDAKDKIIYKEQQKGIFDVTIKRGFLVNLYVDGDMMTANVYSGTVKELLNMFEITLNPTDKINFSVDESLKSGMDVKINRIAYKTVVDEYKIPYKTELIPLTFGKKSNNSDRAGVNGIRKVTRQLKIEDGKVIETRILKEEITKKPVNAVVYSDASNLLNKGRGKPETYKKVLLCSATGYTGVECGGHNTATGKKPQVGYVAVDPRVIPLGTKLYIESEDGSYVYGYAEAQDTGGAIKGNRIDLFLPSLSDCARLGRTKMKVYILS